MKKAPPSLCLPSAFFDMLSTPRASLICEKPLVFVSSFYLRSCSLIVFEAPSKLKEVFFSDTTHCDFESLGGGLFWSKRNEGHLQSCNLWPLVGRKDSTKKSSFLFASDRFLCPPEVCFQLGNEQKRLSREAKNTSSRLASLFVGGLTCWPFYLLPVLSEVRKESFYLR